MSWLIKLLPWVMLLATFLADVLTPSLVILWTPYLLAIVVSTLYGQRIMVGAVTLASCVLTIVAGFISPPGLVDAGPNRLLGMGLMILCGALCLYLDRLLGERQTAVNRLQELNETLERWITERTEAVKQSEERLQLALEASSDGLWDWNVATGEMYFSPRWCETLGYRAPDLRPHINTWEQLIHPDHLPQVLEVLKAHFEGKTPLFECENRLRMKSGEYRWNLSRGKVVNRDEHGKPIRVIGVDSDITERKLAEEKLRYYAAELQERNQQLVRSNQDLDEFAYITSHDLKEPLRGIHSFSQFLLEDYGDKLDASGQQKLHTLIKLSTRLENLIDSLHQYSRLGRVDLALVATDLHKLLEDVIDSLRFNLDEAGVEVRVPQRLPTIVCDHVRVGEIFRNLITNAIKYNDKAEKWIEIGAQATTPPTFYVRDNGIGIRERNHEAIFRIFKRLHGRQEYGGGTGVGLTIVKKIVERHRGRIWVESTPGEGTTFYFTLRDHVAPAQQE